MKVQREQKEKFLVQQDMMLKDVLVAITNNYKGSVIVVDAEGRILGVVSDGDIRRAMIKGATEFTPVSKFINVNAQYLGDTATDEEIVGKFENSKGITMLPLVSEENVVTSVAIPA